MLQASDHTLADSYNIPDVGYSTVGGVPDLNGQLTKELVSPLALAPGKEWHFHSDCRSPSCEWGQDA